MIGGAAQALANRLTAEQFCRAMRPHPSFEEAMTAALEDLCENSAMPATVRRGLRRR